MKLGNLLNLYLFDIILWLLWDEVWGILFYIDGFGVGIWSRFKFFGVGFLFKV